MSFFAAAVLTLAARVLTDTVVSLADGARPGAMNDIVTWAAAVALAYLLCVFVIVRVWAPEESLRSVLGLRPINAFPCLLATIAGAAMYPPVARINEIVARKFPLTSDEQDALAKLLDTSTPGSKVGLLLATIVIIPVASELLFRGAIYGRLRRERAEGLAVFGTTAYFVLANFEPQRMVAMLALGAAVTWLRARTGSLVPALCTHIAFYAMPNVLPLFGRPIPEDYDWSLRWVMGGAAVAVVSIVAALIFANKSESCTQARAVDA
jgi:membrane protease YdiL (CAAX protease family)